MKHSPTFETTILPNRCSNLQCPNLPGEGMYTLLTITDPVVGGHRGISLYLCGPCASAMSEEVIR